VSDRRRDPMPQLLARVVFVFAITALVIDGGLKW
jgi:hypothetical protein